MVRSPVANAAPGNNITFHGSQGKINVNRSKFKMWLGDQLMTDDVKESRLMLQDHLPANAIRLYNSSNHLKDWINSIHTRQPPICDVEIGHRTATICHLVNLTYWHNQALLWDPEKERFAGSSGDPRWMGQEYRKPWSLP